MFITLQFPLIDYRYLVMEESRSEHPHWRDPRQKEKMRYFGQIFGRNVPYKGPWDDEKKYCNARSVINFCGNEPGHFYKTLFAGNHAARILFRRFQSDGRFLGKFEIGFNDNFEASLGKEPMDPALMVDLLQNHIRQYLLCPVKIKVGNKLSAYEPLINAGKLLGTAYYWASFKGKKSFNIKDVKYQVEPCEPVILVHIDSGKADLSCFSSQEIKLQEAEKEKVRLFYRYIPYNIGRDRFNVKTWIIGAAATLRTLPLQSYEFNNFSNTVRYLRINLLRIHVETIIQKKVLEKISSLKRENLISDPATKEKIYNYLHKLHYNLSKIKRNTLPQQDLVETAFRLDESYYRSESIEDMMEGAKLYMEWLEKLPVTDQNQQVVQFAQKKNDDLARKSEEPTLFISYNHHDEKIAAELHAKFVQENIKVIIDSDAMRAGEDIRAFIDNSIKRSFATILVVSTKSLSSGWVAYEIINTFYLEKFTGKKRFIACYIDDDFLNPAFVSEAIPRLDLAIKQLDELIKGQLELGTKTINLDDRRARLLDLRHNMPEIVQRLVNAKSVDIRNEKLEENFGFLLTSIRE